MTPDQKAAIEWLEQAARRAGLAHDCTLMAMLAEPRMPAAPSYNDTVAVLALCDTAVTGTDLHHVRDVWLAIHEYLTKPATKTVQVWRVEGAVRGAERWIPGCCVYATEAEARRRALECELAGWSCIRVTGPHEQEVPA